MNKRGFEMSTLVFFGEDYYFKSKCSTDIWKVVKTCF